MSVEGSQYTWGAMSSRNQALGINDVLNVHPAKVTLVGTLEQRHVICFLLREGLAPTQIPERLSKAYGADAMKRTQVFYWIRDIHSGREDLSDQPRLGRPPQIGLDTILALKLELDPHTTARSLALSLGVSRPTILNRLHKNLGMKCYHLRWIPDLLDDSQKAESLRCAHIMLEALDVHAQTNFRYLMRGDESWMMHDQTPSRMWALNRGHVDAIVRPSHQSRKTMVTAFFGVNGIGLVKILPEGMKLTSRYFKDEILRQIYEGSCGSSDLDFPTPLTLHHDNALVHIAGR
jgi:hypothetical protein